MTSTTIPVGSGQERYDVVVGHGAVGQVADVVGTATAAVVVRPDELASLAQPVVDALESAGLQVATAALPAGEQGKSFGTLAGLWDQFAAARITRSDLVVAVGGGATTDVAGFAAATWLRGVRVVHVPTTLLGMVDAAVGGKTAVNTAAGKNLVGAFHPPAAVLVDLDVLGDLPPPEWVNGMAEVVKAGFIADPAILELVESDPSGAARPDGPHARELIERAIRVKADVVTTDLRESGRRQFLNYGHTLAHAIERVEHFAWPHGHAVGVGLVFAAALSRRAGRLDDETAARHRAVLELLGLPTSYRADAFARLHDAMRVDKKAEGDMLRFVVLDALAQPAILAGPSRQLLEDAYADVAA